MIRNRIIFLALILGCLVSSDLFAQKPVLLKDIYPYFDNAGHVQINNVLYFQAEDGLTGKELWRTDGTVTGTYMVKDLKPGGRGDGSSPTKFFDFKGTLYFKAVTNGEWHLCKSDGTTEGTIVVTDQKRLDYYWMGVYKDKLYFLANTDELWTTDGTSAGTKLVKDFNTANGVKTAEAGKDNLYFTVNTYISGKDALWRSDGTTEGTVVVKEFLTVGYLAIAENGTVFFAADDGTYGMELWKSDGTAGGTTLVKNIRARGNGSAPSNLFAYKNVVYFNAYEDDGPFSSGQLWRSDGTEAGTVRVKNSKNSAFESMHSFERIGDRLVMLDRRSYRNHNIFISDGSDESIKRLGWFMALERPFANDVAGTIYPKTPDGEICYFDVRDSNEEHYNLIKYNPADTLLQRIASVPSSNNVTEGFAMAGRSFIFNMDSDYGLYKFDVCQHTAKINTPNGDSFCPGSSVSITGEGTGGTAAYTYQWKLDKENLGTNANLAATKAGIYTVEITSNGCTVSSSLEIKESTNLPVTLTGSDNFCAGQSTVLTANVAGGIPPYAFQWKQNSANVGESTATLSVNSSGIYTTTVKDSKGCTGTSAGKVITSKPSPVVTITASGTKEFLTGGSVVLSVPSASGQTYQWSKNNNVIAGATNYSYKVSEEGTYTVTVTANGCSATSEPSVVSLILASEPASNSDFEMIASPNPTTGEILAVFKLPKASKIQVSLFDVSGRQMLTRKSTSLNNEHRIPLNLQDLPSGTYILKGEDFQGTKVTSVKIIKK